MSETVTVRVNDRAVTVDEGASVAAAILVAGVTAFRTSVSGEPRGPLCGMGICFECRANVDGVMQRRTCTIPARDGMEVTTDGRG